MKITKRAYGKINLSLEITNKRPDGYHDLTTVMQTVSLYDTISVSNEGNGIISLSCNLPFIPTDNRNIAFKATQLFYQTLQKEPKGIQIDMVKKIPVGGGMAGGSTNCSAVLFGLNEIEGNPFTVQELMSMGGKMGADVPFTMLGTGAALASGIGDKLKIIDPLPSCHIVLCKPKFSISTKLAFGSLNQDNFSNNNMSEKMECALKNGNLQDICKTLFNSFEAPIGKLRPDIIKIKKKLLECGAEGSIMTGSGSTVYGIFANQKKAICARDCLCKYLPETYLAKPI